MKEIFLNVIPGIECGWRGRAVVLAQIFEGGFGERIDGFALYSNSVNSDLNFRSGIWGVSGMFFRRSQALQGSNALSTMRL